MEFLATSKSIPCLAKVSIWEDEDTHEFVLCTIADEMHIENIVLNDSQKKAILEGNERQKCKVVEKALQGNLEEPVTAICRKSKKTPQEQILHNLLLIEQLPITDPKVEQLKEENKKLKNTKN